jgi:hypothetical protein
MNYKVKSLIYLFAFILSALLYHEMDAGSSSEPIEQSREITMLGTTDIADQDTLL